MKLIIDIPDYEYRQIKEVYEKNDIVESTYAYIYHGTPLDDVKAEINEITEEYCDLCAGYCGVSKKYVTDILDNIGKDKGGE